MSRPLPSPEVSPASSPGAGPVYELGDFRLDCGRFALSHKGQPVRLERKPLELLILLVSREGQLVTRAEIAQRLRSSEVFVDTEHGINTAIGKLRHLLQDDAEDPHFIQTVTGMGYRFVAPVATVSTPAPVLPCDGIAEPSVTAPEVTPSARSRKRQLGWYVAAGPASWLRSAGCTSIDHGTAPWR